MNEKKIRDLVRQAITKAAEEKAIRKSWLARQVGWNASSITSLMNDGYGDFNKVLSLFKILKEMGFVPDDQPVGYSVRAENELVVQPCPNCGKNTPAYFDGLAAAFCIHYGHCFWRLCPKCGHGNPAENRFCGLCGAALVLGVVPQQKRAAEDGEKYLHKSPKNHDFAVCNDENREGFL